MKNRGTLVLIEQTVMLLVFAISAALCLRAFLWADGTSKEIADRDQAAACVQNAAEVIKTCRGDGAAAVRLYGGEWDGSVWTVHYDKDWTQSSAPSEYRLTVTPVSGEQAFLGTAAISVFRGESDLVQMSRYVAWQEVTADE